MSTTAATRTQLPELPLTGWEPTKDTLHLWLQIVGKVRMASTRSAKPLVARSALRRRAGADHAPHARGDGVAFEIDFDFVDHRLVVSTNRGESSRSSSSMGCPSPSSTRSCTRRSPARRRRHDPRDAVRRADDDALPG